MMKMWSIGAATIGWYLMALSSTARAQTPPWDVFVDDLSTSVCDVVNTVNAELVVLSDTGELVIVTGRDVILEDAIVDPFGDVSYLGDPAGFIDFAEDGDGLRTLWWLSLTGRVIRVDDFTGEPTVSNRLPVDFSNVLCDACLLWDDQTVCQQDGNDVPTEPPPFVINLCGMNSQLGLGLTLSGLTLMSLVRRRSRCVY